MRLPAGLSTAAVPGIAAHTACALQRCYGYVAATAEQQLTAAAAAAPAHAVSWLICLRYG
jgi:hypothetical protein